MKKIIVFELKKLFRNHLIIMMFLFLSVLNVYRIYSGYRDLVAQEPQYYNARFQEYARASGEWSNEKISYVLENYQKAKAIIDAGGYSTEPNQPGTVTGYVFGDYGLFGEIKNEMDTMYHYADTTSSITKKAADYAKFYTEKGNTFEAKRNRLIVQTYQNRNVNAFYDTSGLKAYFKYDFSTLLILVLLIPLLSPLYAREHELEMQGLLQITQNYPKMTVCKMIAGTSAVCIVSILFFIQDFAAFTILYRIEGLSQPVYTLPGFFYSPLNISITSYILCNAAFKILCFLVFGFLCMMISALVKNEVIPFCITLVTAAFLILADAFLNLPAISCFNPVTLLSSAKLFQEFSTVNICNIPIFSWILSFSAAVTECMILSVITFLICRYKTKQRRCRHEI